MREFGGEVLKSRKLEANENVISIITISAKVQKLRYKQEFLSVTAQLVTASLQNCFTQKHAER